MALFCYPKPYYTWRSSILDPQFVCQIDPHIGGNRIGFCCEVSISLSIRQNRRFVRVRMDRMARNRNFRGVVVRVHRYFSENSDRVFVVNSPRTLS